MNYKTPHSLNWLIKQRARLAGEQKLVSQKKSMRLDDLKKLLSSLEKECELIKGMIKDIQNIDSDVTLSLQRQLQAIDTALSMHEIKIDPLLIKPKYANGEHLLPHGVLTKSIKEALLYRPNIDKKQITNYVIERNSIERNEHILKKLSISIRYRLKELVRAKVISRNKLVGETLSRYSLNQINREPLMLDLI